MVELVVVEGKTRLKQRRASPQTIMPEQIETFFETLADTCNVVRSAKAAGFTANWAYRRRRFDAAFRNGWAAAVREGYSKLELVLLERAMKGTPRLVRTAKGNDRVMREYSTALAVALLRRHAETAETAESAEYEPEEGELQEVRERILQKLEGLRRREAEQALTPLASGESPAPGSGPSPRRSEPAAPARGEGLIETKGWFGRIETIRWALRGGHHLSIQVAPPLMRRFAMLPPEEQWELLSNLSLTDLLALDADFEAWAHPGQLPPDGEGWRVWLMMAGRGFGKTRAGAEWVHRLALQGGKRIALVAASIDEARSVMVEGVSGLLAIACNRKIKVRWEPSLGRMTWPKGSVATLYSGDSPDGLRGPEHHISWWRCRESTCCCARQSKGRRSPLHQPALQPAHAIWSRPVRPGLGRGRMDRSPPFPMAAGDLLLPSREHRWWTSPAGKWSSGATAAGKQGSRGCRKCGSMG